MTAQTETDLFGVILQIIGVVELVNEVIEITLPEMPGEYEVQRYALPNTES